MTLASTAAADAVIVARGAGLTYPGGVEAIAGIDLAVPRGEFVAVVGPSGCGKSTLLRLIAGLVRPSAGLVQLAGQEPAVARGRSVRLSFVFQDATLLPWRTVANNVALPLELLGQDRAARGPLVAAGLALVGLGQFARRFPAQLSGGMRMRVSLARALVTEPDLLLFDEPFAALDDLTRCALVDEVHGLWRRRGWTGLFVTHNIGEAVFLAQRVLVMSARPGRIAAEIVVPPAPRERRWRASAEFAATCGQVTDALGRTAA